MNFFEELKRRNVFRVGIAYGVASWVLLQIVDLVLDNIAAPDWVMKVFMLAVALGFVAAVLIAWAYELTPEGIKRESDIDRSQSITPQTGRKLDRLIIGFLAIAVLLLLADRVFVKGSEPFSQATTETVEESVDQKRALTPVEKSIAVLPFVDMSAEGDQAYFADGIAEEILNVLVKTRSLKVAGRTSSFQFRDRSGDLREIGKQLDVEHILEGSIRKSNNRLRITAQLVKASDGFHLWSESYDRDLTDIFAIQDEIARAITKALAIELDLAGSSTSLAPVKTNNMDAYDRYLEAKNLIALRTDFPRMIRLLEEATQLDPEFADGWATLAQARGLTIYYGVEELDSALHAAETYARRAIELDPSSSDAHTALANVIRDQGLLNEAWTSYQKALKLNPDNIEAHVQFGQMLIRAGLVREALVHSTRATELDPLSWVNQSVQAVVLYVNGDHEAAWRSVKKSEVLGDFRRSLVVRIKLRMALSEGLKDEARQTVSTFMLNPHETEDREKFYFVPMIEMLDKPDRARDYLRNIDLDGQSDIVTRLFWLAYFEEFELADRWMERALERVDELERIDPMWLQFPPVYPLFDSPEFKRLMKKSRLDTFWRVHGWPEFCRPISEDDFECGMDEES